MPRNHFRINEPSVIHQIFDDELVAVNLVTGTYHALPGLAGEAFLLFGGAGASLSEVAAALEAKYAATTEEIARDMEPFVSELHEKGILVAVEPPSDTRPAPLLPAQEPKLPYSAPGLTTFNDLQELFLLDPVHDVGAAGWPHVAPSIANSLSDGAAPALVRCRLAGANVIFERFQTETVAMHLGTGAYHSLSGPAQDIFLLFSNEPTTAEIRNALAAKYVVEPADLDAALREYLDELVRGGLIVVEAIAEDMPERDLALIHPGAGEEFTRPTLETFAQPSFESNATLYDEEATLSLAGLGGTTDASRSRRYALRPNDLLFSEAAGEFVVSDRDGGRYFKLNSAASDIFRMLEREADVAELVAALRKKYIVPEQDLRVAVMILLSNLRKLGLTVLAPGDATTHTIESADDGAPSVPFPGFDVSVHHDLEELLRPFNPALVSHPKPNLTQVRQFLGVMESNFQDAVDIFGVSETTYMIAGRAVKIRCAGEGQSAQIKRALEHLASDTDGQDLTIHMWDSATVPPGPLLGAVLSRLYDNWLDACGPRGEFLGFHTGPIAAIFHPGPETLSVVDTETGHAFYLLRDDSPLPFWELSSPFRHILHPWFSARGLQYTHAAAVGSLDGGVLLVGKGGSGKSSTALLCVSAGMQYAGDDYCITDADSAHVFSLYNTAKLKGPEDLERIPAMRNRSFNADSFEHGGVGKGTFNLSELWPERMASGFPIRAIFLPVVTSDVDSRLEPCSPSDALLALAPSTVGQLPASAQIDCTRLAVLAGKVPAFRLYLGSDLDQIPALIKNFLG